VNFIWQKIAIQFFPQGVDLKPISLPCESIVVQAVCLVLSRRLHSLAGFLAFFDFFDFLGFFSVFISAERDAGADKPTIVFHFFGVFFPCLFLLRGTQALTNPPLFFIFLGFFFRVYFC